MISYQTTSGWVRAGLLGFGCAFTVAACSTNASNAPGDDGGDSGSSNGNSSSNGSGGDGSGGDGSGGDGSGGDGAGGDRSSTGTGGSGAGCEVGDEACECYPNDTCNGALSCLSGVCVQADTNGSGGSSAGGSGGGTSQGSGGDGSVGGGTSQGSGGDSSTGGTSQGSGGGSSQGSGGGTSQGSGGSGGGGDEVGDASIIDNFSSCNTTISLVAGRDGDWYTFGDDDINVAGGVGQPPSGFSSDACAAWTTGGCDGGSNCTFGGNGFELLASGGGYDLSAYSGIVFSIETDQDLWVLIRSTNGAAWGATVTSTGAGQANRSVMFNALSESGDSIADLDLTHVNKIEFTATEPDAYGWAIWDVSLL